MRSLYRISLALLAMGFLAVAGSAFAQDQAKPALAFTGNIGAGFGSYTYDKTSDVKGAASATKAFSELATAYEANLKWAYSTEAWTSIARIRIRQMTGGSGFTDPATANTGVRIANDPSGSNNDMLASGSDVYIEAWWTPGAFKLGIGKFAGQDWNQPIAGSYNIRNNIGDGEYFMNWTGVPGLDAEYNLGVIQIGVAAATICNPSCNSPAANSAVTGAAAATGTASTAKNQTDNTMSIVPHIAGSAGDISFRAQFPSTSGTINCATGTATACSTGAFGGAAGTTAATTKGVSGSGFQVGVKWAGPNGLAVAADAQSFTDTHLKVLAQLKDRSRTGYDVKFDVPAGPGSVTLAYFSLSDNNAGVTQSSQVSASGAPTFSGHTYTGSTATLRYTIPVSFGQIIPEYRSDVCGGCVAVTNTAKAGTSPTPWKDGNNNEFRLILNSLF